MANRITIQATQLSDNVTQPIVLTGKIISVIIRNNPASAEDLWVGINENATDKIPLNPSDTFVLEAREGTYFDGIELRFAFAAVNSNNKAVCIVQRELDERVC